MSKFIITGGQGFIGGKITEKVNGCAYDLKDGLDILNKSQFKEASAGADGIFHCAAKISVAESILFPDEYRRVNTEGTARVIAVAKENKVRRLVFSSSAAVYGDTDGMVTENTALNPKSPYATQKMEGEIMLRNSALSSVVLRYFNVYGPGQSDAYAGVVGAFIKKALAGEDLVVYGDGSQSRDFICVDDVVDANIAAMNLAFESSYEVFNIASGTSITVIELAEKIVRLTNSQSKILFKPQREGDILHSQADISKAVEYLKWRPKVSLDDGLKETIGYYKSLVYTV